MGMLQQPTCDVSAHEHTAVDVEVLGYHLADQLGTVRPHTHALGRDDTISGSVTNCE